MCVMELNGMRQDVSLTSGTWVQKFEEVDAFENVSLRSRNDHVFRRDQNERSF